MLVVDASCLYEVLTDGPLAPQVRKALASDPDQVAPHVVDAEVMGLLRRDHLLNAVDETTSALAVEDLGAWPGERYSVRLLLPRIWALRSTVRTWDACYVALAESMDCALLTLDGRLSRATGPECAIELVQ